VSCTEASTYALGFAAASPLQCTFGCGVCAAHPVAYALRCAHASAFSAVVIVPARVSYTDARMCAVCFAGASPPPCAAAGAVRAACAVPRALHLAGAGALAVDVRVSSLLSCLCGCGVPVGVPSRLPFAVLVPLLCTWALHHRGCRSVHRCVGTTSWGPHVYRLHWRLGRRLQRTNVYLNALHTHYKLGPLLFPVAAAVGQAVAAH
jgi:hypothetical protein